MSRNFTTKFRQSTEIFNPDCWYIYRDFGNQDHELIIAVDSREAAQKIVNRSYKDEVKLAILSLDDDQNVTEEFLNKVLAENLYKVMAVEVYFNENPYDISTLKPLKGQVDREHSVEVNKLIRPYIAITNDDLASLNANISDYYLTTNGKVVSFGRASTEGGNKTYSLMPLNAKESEKLLLKNK
jgi:hypothetical protein